MRKLRLLTITALCCGIFVSCGNRSDGNDNPGNSGNASVSSENAPVVEDGVGELITPDEDSEEYELGSYRISSNGIKLYYDDDIPTEIMLTLEKYFKSFADNDYNTYVSCLYPSYIEEYNAFLEENYQYDLETSFSTQCANLESNMESSYIITRIKAEHDEELTDDESVENAVKNFFSMLDQFFDKDYYSETAEASDGFEYLTFYVMAQGDDGQETMLISDFDIVFAEKDGQYYTFG